MEIANTLANDLKVSVTQIEAAIRLMDQGDTVPFIARYRKEVTQNLTDTQLRYIEERLHQLRELAARRDSILEALRTQAQLTPELEQAILAAQTKARLEDLYLPFRPRRHTKAQLAKDAGLAPLAECLLLNPQKDPLSEAQAYVNEEKQIATPQQALDGARQILMERFAEDADLIQKCRVYVWEHATLKSTARSKKKSDAQKFKDYFEYQERIKKIPAHRGLALFRGRREEVLSLTLILEDEAFGTQAISAYFSLPESAWLNETVQMTWKMKLWPKLELEAFSKLKELADEESIRVFTRNLRALLLASPAGQKVIMGLDPGIRTGIKVVVVDATGKLLDYSVVYPFAPELAKEEAIAELAKLVIRNQVELVSIGNGTASRETEQLVAEMMKRYPDLACARVIVNEAGASVYSASAVASAEFPDLDVTLRGAVSIARRLQDPLAELVKIDPKAIGVGQYQHDVNQPKLSRSLDAIVEDCVNLVGVDVNTASIPLLARVAGLNESLAKHIVQYRDEHGSYKNRENLRSVHRMGPKAFEQSAGFLRIKGGENPLDASGVHPEVYEVVERILKDNDLKVEDILGKETLLKNIDLTPYVNEQHGLVTLKDILHELEKPGLDPRPTFKMVSFTPGVEKLIDLKPGMVLEGVVSNVTNFGAFVDVGVHQDGLVHISELTSSFVTDPHSILKAGDIVTVKVIEVDESRRRIGLSMKSLQEKGSTPVTEKKPVKLENRPTRSAAPATRLVQKKQISSQKKSANPPMNTAMADALAKWKTK
jgi:uncharacterized protein